MTKAELMRKIQSLAFAKLEAGLYLDCHPDNRAALEYYHKLHGELDALVLEYSNKYGPITADDSSHMSWNWVEGAWPWQIDFEMEDK